MTKLSSTPKMDPPTDEEFDISVWLAALEEVKICVPKNIRAEVIRQLADHEKSPPYYEVQVGDHLERIGAIIGPYCRDAKEEAVSLVIQWLVRRITRHSSKWEAAKVLFREHKSGTLRAWLPNYLEGLPGLTIDRERCISIAQSNCSSYLDARGDYGHHLEVLAKIGEQRLQREALTIGIDAGGMDGKLAIAIVEPSDTQ